MDGKIDLLFREWKTWTLVGLRPSRRQQKIPATDARVIVKTAPPWRKCNIKVDEVPGYAFWLTGQEGEVCDQR